MIDYHDQTHFTSHVTGENVDVKLNWVRRKCNFNGRRKKLLLIKASLLDNIYDRGAMTSWVGHKKSTSHSLLQSPMHPGTNTQVRIVKIDLLCFSIFIFLMTNSSLVTRLKEHTFQLHQLLFCCCKNAYFRFSGTCYLFEGIIINCLVTNNWSPYIKKSLLLWNKVSSLPTSSIHFRQRAIFQNSWFGTNA